MRFRFHGNRIENKALGPDVEGESVLIDVNAAHTADTALSLPQHEVGLVRRRVLVSRGQEVNQEVVAVVFRIPGTCGSRADLSPGLADAWIDSLMVSLAGTRCRPLGTRLGGVLSGGGARSQVARGAPAVRDTG